MSAPSPNSLSNYPPNYQTALKSMESSLTQLSRHQHGTLQVHQQCLNNQLEYAKTFFNLMQQQNELLLGPSATERPDNVKISVI